MTDEVNIADKLISVSVRGFRAGKRIGEGEAQVCFYGFAEEIKRQVVNTFIFRIPCKDGLEHEILKIVARVIQRAEIDVAIRAVSGFIRRQDELADIVFQLTDDIEGHGVVVAVADPVVDGEIRLRQLVCASAQEITQLRNGRNGDNLIADIEGEIDERAGEQRFQIRRDVVVLFQLIRQRIHQAGDIRHGAFDGQLMIDGGEIAVRRDIVGHVDIQRCDEFTERIQIRLDKRRGEACVSTDGFGKLGKRGIPVHLFERGELRNHRIVCAAEGEQRFPFGGDALPFQQVAFDADAVDGQVQREVHVHGRAVFRRIRAGKLQAVAILDFAQTAGEPHVIQDVGQRIDLREIGIVIKHGGIGLERELTFSADHQPCVKSIGKQGAGGFVRHIGSGFCGREGNQQRQAEKKGKQEICFLHESASLIEYASFLNSPCRGCKGCKTCIGCGGTDALNMEQSGSSVS